MSSDPFGRQPLPVTIRFEGDPRDVDFWLRELLRRAEYKGDTTQRLGPSTFKIYPRAVND